MMSLCYLQWIDKCQLLHLTGNGMYAGNKWVHYNPQKEGYPILLAFLYSCGVLLVIIFIIHFVYFQLFDFMM